jgi:O-antigen/teichoic acid export membrane protein
MGPFKDIKYLILILIFSNLVDSFNQIFYCISIVYGKIKYLTAMFILKDAATVGLSVFFLIHGGILPHVVICFLIGSIVFFILGIILVNKLKIKFTSQKNFSEIFELVKRNAPFLLAFIFSFMLLKIDLVILKLLKGNNEAGLFRAGSSFLVSLEVFPVFFMLVLYPKFSRLAEKNKPLLIKLYNKTFSYLLVLNLIMLIPLFIFSKPLILLVFGNKFAGSAEILKYMVVPVFFLFQNTCNVYFLNAVNKPGFNAFIYCLGSALNIILDFILIPAYSYYGVLMATAISFSLIFILSAYIIDMKIARPCLMPCSKDAIRHSSQGGSYS